MGQRADEGIAEAHRARDEAQRARGVYREGPVAVVFAFDHRTVRKRQGEIAVDSDGTVRLGLRHRRQRGRSRPRGQVCAVPPTTRPTR